jgi:triosephosphate isomerase
LRKRLIAGNWKMHGTVAEARLLAQAVVAAISGETKVEVLLAPPFTALAAVSEIARPAGLRVAAQDMHWAAKGAFTGAISPAMVAEWAEGVILGHSERRALFGESDLEVNRKLHAAVDAGLMPILCIGETEDRRDAGQADAVVLGQLEAALEGLDASEIAAMVVAYEPVWAIGTGRACDPDEAGRMMGLIRSRLAGRIGDALAGRLRLLYGGSVKPDNVDSYLAAADIDGALVGGASLEAASFAALVSAAAR